MIPDGPRVDAGLIVNDLDLMLDFYHGALGVPVLEERNFPSGTRIVVLDAGGTRLKLNRPEPPPTVTPRSGRHRDALGLRYLSVVVTNAAAIHEALAERSAGSLGPLRESPSGLLFFVRDPEGTWVEIVQPLAAPDNAAKLGPGEADI